MQEAILEVADSEVIESADKQIQRSEYQRDGQTQPVPHAVCREKTAPRQTEPDRFRQDRQLVDRCVSGDVEAWQRLYDEFHGPLLRSLSSMLAGPSSAELSEELAARVWCSLAENDGAVLDRYDPSRGARFVTFLRLIARDEVKRHFRSEGRRKQREIAVGMSRQPADGSDSSLWAGMDGFVEALTPAEKRFFDDVLLPSEGVGDDSDREQAYSKTNRWQLRHRIREKLQQHLGL